jgi:osmotically-inducible protein OsmY
MVPDERIADVVLTAIRDEPRLEGISIARVDVAHGVVKVEGSVGNLYQKRVLEGIVIRQDGVKRVLNEVSVVAETAPDEQIAESIREGIVQAPEVGLREVGVDVAGGVVTLVGRINNRGEERVAMAAASRVPGVREVRSQIAVGAVPTEETIAIVDDAALRSRVASALAQANVDVLDQDLAARDGVVYLRGTVTSESERERAEQVAVDVDGVRGARNELRVL